MSVTILRVHLAPDLTSFAAALALGTVYPVTQWEAAIRRVQDILKDTETTRNLLTRVAPTLTDPWQLESLAHLMRLPKRPPSGLHVTREQVEAALNRKATR